MLLKRTKPKEIVIYNYNLSNQDLTLLYRRQSIPSYYRGYKHLWRFRDKEKQTETVIICV